MKKNVTKMVSCCIVYNVTTKNPCQHFELVNDQIKAKLIELASYASDVTYQPLGHSKCDKVCDTDSYNK